MDFKINNIENIILYDDNHNPIQCFDCDSMIITSCEENVLIEKEPNNGDRVHFITKIEDLTLEVTGFYENKILY